VPRLFRLAGLADVSVTPAAILGNAAFWRILYQHYVDRLQDQGTLTAQEATQWWAGLEGPAQEASFLGGAVIFLTAATIAAFGDDHTGLVMYDTQTAPAARA